MHALDWIITAVPLLVVLLVGVFVQRYMKSVADFMAGGRLAGRYLLAVAKGEMEAGLVVFVASFEVFSRAGFTLTWWNWLQPPVFLFIAVTGFVIYRFRETRALTLAQFFEIRYSRRFRIFTGMLAFLAGVVNFGIIPAVGARFFVYFFKLPDVLAVFSFHVPTYVLIMAVLLVVTTFITLTGGILTVMITNCVEGILSQIFYLIIIAGLVAMFSWSDINEVLSGRPPGQSMLNPFDSQGLKDFNIWYVLMGMFVAVYGTMAWQNASAYNSAALSAHESRMGGILGRWRELGKIAVIYLMAACAVTFLQSPHFAQQATEAHAAIASVAQPTIRDQMTIPIALSYLLPIGIKGVLCAVLLMGIFGGDSTHLHSWGSIFVQDVLVPLRKRPFTPESHIWALRLSVVGVACFAFLFGALFRQTEYIYMWWSVTTSIYVGGAGAAIIGGLYWKRGSTAGAWAGLLTGSLLSVGGILARQILDTSFPLNGREIFFYATIIAILVYVVVSLLTSRGGFNLERMLHRGSYAVSAAKDQVAIQQRTERKISWWDRIVGIDAEFSRGDRWIAGSIFIWTMSFALIMIGGSIWNLIAPWPVSVWSTFWHIAIISLPIALAVVTAIWFTWGGVSDMISLFRRLRAEKQNPLDDGSVAHHRNLDEVGSK